MSRGKLHRNIFHENKLLSNHDSDQVLFSILQFQQHVSNRTFSIILRFRIVFQTEYNLIKNMIFKQYDSCFQREQFLNKNMVPNEQSFSSFLYTSDTTYRLVESAQLYFSSNSNLTHIAVNTLQTIIIQQSDFPVSFNVYILIFFLILKIFYVHNLVALSIFLI